MSEEKIYKYRLKVTKNKELKFISHLDWQNLILKILRRCELKLVLSEGFNRMPKVSYSPALPIFIESNCEMINFQTKEIPEKDFKEKFEKYSPAGIKIISITQTDSETNKLKSLENYLQWAKYETNTKNFKNHVYNLEKIRYIIEECLSSNKFLIGKKTKKGIEKTVNYRNSIKSLEVNDDGLLTFVLKVGQHETIPALRADEFLKILFPDENIFTITRTEFFDTEMRVV